MILHLQDNNASGKVGWIRNEDNGEHLMLVLRGITLELIHRYVLSMVYQEQYSEQKQLHDLRIAMGPDFSTVAVEGSRTGYP